MSKTITATSPPREGETAGTGSLVSVAVVVADYGNDGGYYVG